MESVKEESLFKENDITNKEYYNGIKELINCSICLDIIKDPIQCDKCQNCFCTVCAEKVKSCPLRCINSKFFPSLLCRNLLSKLIIKCSCGKEIGYDSLEKHKKEECVNADFKKNYLELKKKYEILMKEYNKININSNSIIKGKRTYIKTRIHPHPVKCIRRFISTWSCDICSKSYKSDVPSYQCTLCDYDICYKCVINKITEGSIIREMSIYY